MNPYEILESLYQTNPEIFQGVRPKAPSLDEIDEIAAALGESMFLQRQAD